MAHASVECFKIHVDVTEWTQMGRFQEHGDSVTDINDMKKEQLFRIHNLWTRQSILNAHYVIL